MHLFQVCRHLYESGIYEAWKSYLVIMWLWQQPITDCCSANLKFRDDNIMTSKDLKMTGIHVVKAVTIEEDLWTFMTILRAPPLMRTALMSNLLPWIIVFPAPGCYITYQRRETVFYHICKHREESWKYDGQWSIFDELQGVWKCSMKHSWVMT